jgi:hypothetical protein
VGDRGGDGRGDDRPRLLAARSEYGYTDRPDRSLRDEPEAVAAYVQDTFTAAAHRRARERQVEAFTSASSVINGALDTFLSAVGGGNPRLTSSVRAIRRSTDALGRRVTQ